MFQRTRQTLSPAEAFSIGGGINSVILSYLRLLTLWILIIQTALPVQVFASAPSQSVQRQVAESPLPEFEIHLPNDDSTRDEDPFFLKSQSWVAPPATASEDEILSQQSGAHSIDILVPYAKKALRIQHNLRITGISEEFIFLAPQPTEASTKTEQGFFVISIAELQQVALSDITPQMHAPKIPIFFFPLPEANWGSAGASALEIPQQNTVLFSDGKGESIPVESRDIELVISAERINLNLAQIQAIQTSPSRLLNDSQFNEGAIQLNNLLRASQNATLDQEHWLSITKTYLSISAQMISSFQRQWTNFDVLPNPRSTAGFGMFFIPEENTSKDNVTNRDPILPLKSGLQWIWKALSPTSAEAFQIFSEVPLPRQIARFAAVSAVALIASVVLKYTVFRNHFRERARCEDSLLAEKPQSLPSRVLSRIRREIRDIGTVNAHTLTSISQFPGVWFGNVVEAAGDRYAPRLFSAENSLIRRFLSSTVYFVRDAAEKLPVSSFTWFMGGLVMGGIDTLNYYVQLYHAVPAVAFAIASTVPALQGRVTHAFDSSNEQTSSLSQYEVIRCGIFYANAGASQFSSSWRSQLLQSVTNDVEEEMILKGLNPKASENTTLRAERIQAKLEEVLQSQGLPGKDEFLFDANTIYEQMVSFLGYTPPQNQNSETENSPTAHWGKNRPALITPAVHRALEYARKLAHEQSQDPIARAAMFLLEDVKTNLSLTKSFLVSPGKALLSGSGTLQERLERARRRVRFYKENFRILRQELVGLTYEAPLEDDLKYNPDSWSTRLDQITNSSLDEESKRKAITLAGNLFRNSYISYISGDQSGLEKFLSTPKDENVSQFTENETNEYKPLKQGFFARWQQKRALRKAQAAYILEYGSPYDGSGDDSPSSDEQQRWNRIYSKALMNTIGLWPDLKEKVETRQELENDAIELTLRQIRDNPGLKKYLASLAPQERGNYIASIYADHAIKTYLLDANQTLSTEPLATDQPGRLQRFRQISFVKNSKFLTRAARGIESLFSSTSYRLGLSSLLERTIPLFSDMRQSNSRSYRGALTGALAYYQFNSAVYGMHLTPSMWVFNLMTRFLIGGPEQTVNRAFRMQGLKPMGKVSTMVAFAFIFSWATFWGSIPIQIFASDFQNLWTTGSHFLQEHSLLWWQWMRRW